jgi:hypothetical protein
MAGCTAPTPQQQRVIGALCQADALTQPLVVEIAPIVYPPGAPIATLDEALLHPTIVSACAAFTAAPVGVVVAPTPSPL